MLIPGLPVCDMEESDRFVNVSRQVNWPNRFI
jgi:hypothetical protein